MGIVVHWIYAWSMEHGALEDDFLMKTSQGPRRRLDVLSPQCAAQRHTSELLGPSKARVSGERLLV